MSKSLDLHQDTDDLSLSSPVALCDFLVSDGNSTHCSSTSQRKVKLGSIASIGFLIPTTFLSSSSLSLLFLYDAAASSLDRNTRLIHLPPDAPRFEIVLLSCSSDLLFLFYTILLQMDRVVLQSSPVRSSRIPIRKSTPLPSATQIGYTFRRHPPSPYFNGILSTILQAREVESVTASLQLTLNSIRKAKDEIAKAEISSAQSWLTRSDSLEAGHEGEHS